MSSYYNKQSSTVLQNYQFKMPKYGGDIYVWNEITIFYWIILFNNY